MRPLRTVHPPYRDRRDAGQALAEALGQHLHEPNLLILGLPRGGVAVAYEVAKALHAPLDIWVVRKLGLPGHEEYAMGAIASGGVRVMNPLQGIEWSSQASDEEVCELLDKAWTERSLEIGQAAQAIEPTRPPVQ
jgi:hypothetical protein